MPVAVEPSLALDEQALVRACSVADPAALARFRARYGAVIRQTIARTGVDPATAADIEQTVWIRLFVPKAGEPAKIATFAGTGSLRAWVKVVAGRVALAAIEGKRPTSATLEATLSDPADDLELAYMKRLYGSELARAITDAVAELDRAQRKLLHRYYVSRMTIDQLASIHGIHRVTALRRVRHARAQLLERMRELLGERLALGEGSVASVLRICDDPRDFELARALDAPTTN